MTAAPAQGGSLAGAISPGGIFADAFPGPSWGLWRTILKAVEGLPITGKDRAAFHAVAGDRKSPTRRVKEAWIIGGRRGGKDSVVSAAAVVLALADHSRHLRPGELGTVLCVANTQRQAGIVFRYIRGLLTSSPTLRALIVRETADTIELSNSTEITVAPPNFRSVRGKTVIAAILDECAFYADEESAASDVELYAAILPAMATIPDAILFGISSPHGRTGLLHQKFVESYGKDDPDVLVVKAPSRMLNPTLDQKLVDDALARDPERAASEYLAEFRSDVGDFLGRDLLDAATDRGVVVRPPAGGIEYVAACDPSGGRGDSFCVAITHAEPDGVVVLDAATERRAPFDPSSVVAEASDLLRQYGVSTVRGDRYSAQWVAEAFAREGIRYETSAADKSATYLETLPLFTSGRVRLLDIARLTHQLVGLRRYSTRGGRDRVDHQHGGADDLGNAVAHALVRAASEAKPGLIRSAQLLQDGAGVPLPRYCQSIDAVIWTDSDGIAATTYWSWTDRATPPGVLLDFTAAQIGADTVQTAYDTAHSYARQCNMAGSGRLYVPKVLAEQYAHLGVDPIPPAWLTDINALRLAVGTQTAGGRVKLSTVAAEKAAGTAFAGSLESWMKQPDALAVSFMAGTVLAMGLPVPRW